MKKLLPCPFCGGEARLEKFPVKNLNPHVYYEVRCAECYQTNIHGRFDTFAWSTEEKAKEKAIEAWNTRPSNWHTGIPTEEGWYLFKFADSGVSWFDTEYLTLGRIKALEEWDKLDNCKWQKIEDTDR